MARRLSQLEPQDGAIRTAEAATDLVVAFVKDRGRYFVRPVSAKRTADTWTVLVDVGVFGPKVGTFHVDAKTGVIRDFDIPA